MQTLLQQPEPVIRPTTKADALGMWGHVQPYAFRGITVAQGPKILAIAGVLHSNPMQAFMTMSDELKDHRRTIVLAIREFRKVMEQYSGPIYAFPNATEPTARRFLAFTGFTPQTDEVYQWTQ